MLARCVSGAQVCFKSAIASKASCMKTLACNLHTATHIPLMDANMETLEITFNPRDKKSHNSSVGLYFARVRCR